jgi:hypothetical protein
MISPANLRRGGLLVSLLIGTSAVDANIAPLAWKPTLVSKSAALSVSATELAPSSGAVGMVVEEKIPRGGDGEVGLAARLKVGSYFAVWYILNIIYNSKYVGVSIAETIEPIPLVMSGYPKMGIFFHV